MSLGFGGAQCCLAILVTVIALPIAACDDRNASQLSDHVESRKVSWSARAALNTYLFAKQPDYVQATAAADYGALHLEGRYNYEARRTGSLWVGWNFEWGRSLRLALTPMLGGVMGDLNGIAPGLEVDLSWGPLELYSETEWVFDLGNWSASNYYTWSELSGSPFDWLRAGLALQRTHAVASARTVQWGPLVGVQVWKLSASAYWFNPGQVDAQYWVLSLGASF